jgi:hypothetical protein
MAIQCCTRINIPSFVRSTKLSSVQLLKSTSATMAFTGSGPTRTAGFDDQPCLNAYLTDLHTPWLVRTTCLKWQPQLGCQGYPDQGSRSLVPHISSLRAVIERLSEASVSKKPTFSRSSQSNCDIRQCRFILICSTTLRRRHLSPSHVSRLLHVQAANLFNPHPRHCMCHRELCSRFCSRYCYVSKL